MHVRPRVEMAILLARNAKRMVTYVRSLPETVPEQQKATANPAALAFP